MLAFAIISVLTVQGVFGSCGMRAGSSRIVGGNPAEAHSWPWQASLMTSGWLSSHICGATIISGKFLVTAAHCVDGLSTGQLLVVVGDHDKRIGERFEVRHSLNSIIMHKHYNGNGPSAEGFPHDIALLKVTGTIAFNQHVQPACLPGDENLNLVGNNDCWITGWGETQGPQDKYVLQELNIEVRTNADCANIWGQGTIHDTHVCLGHGQSGACNGDSGGPLVCSVNCRYMLAGVASWGIRGCQTAGLPSVYTRVSKYLSWIEKNAY